MPLVVFYYPLLYIESYISGGFSVKNLLLPPYWFIRVYLYLFLFSPVINYYIKDLNAIKRLYLLAVLGFIAIYMAMVGDKSLSDGKNLVYFIFIYVIGNTVKVYSEQFRNIRTFPLLISFIVGNVFLVSMCFFDDLIYKIVWKLAYPYCSPILVINAICLFLLFDRMKFKSCVINWAASSSLAIYVIHQQDFILYNIIKPIILKIVDQWGANPLIVITILGGLTCIIMLLSLLIDKLITPLYSFSYGKVSKLQNIIYEKYGH